MEPGKNTSENMKITLSFGQELRFLATPETGLFWGDPGLPLVTGSAKGTVKTETIAGLLGLLGLQGLFGGHYRSLAEFRLPQK